MVNGIPLGIALEVMKNNNEPGYELLVVHSFCALCYNFAYYFIVFFIGYCSCYRVVVLQVPGLCSWSSELSGNSFPCLGTCEVVFRDGCLLWLERRDNKGRRT